MNLKQSITVMIMLYQSKTINHSYDYVISMLYSEKQKENENPFQILNHQSEPSAFHTHFSQPIADLIG